MGGQSALAVKRPAAGAGMLSRRSMKRATREDYRQRIQRVLGHLQTHLDEALVPADLAQIACFSPHHFHRIFRGMVGESVMQHVRRLRLERAALRLKHGDRSVTAIAFADIAQAGTAIMN